MSASRKNSRSISCSRTSAAKRSDWPTWWIRRPRWSLTHDCGGGTVEAVGAFFNLGSRGPESTGMPCGELALVDECAHDG
jgi:hypothetical protein